MKRQFPFVLLALSALLCAAVPAGAQNIGVGIRAGLNLAGATNHSFDSHEDSQRRLEGLVVGGLVEYSVDPRFSLQLEAQYVEKGAKIVSSWGGQFGETTLKYRMTYLEFPITLKAKFGGPDLAFYGGAGPRVGLRLKAEGESITDGGEVTFVDLTNSTKSFDLGLDVAGGVEYALSSKFSFYSDVRFGLGLVDINNYHAPFTIGSWNSLDMKMTAGMIFRP